MSSRNEQDRAMNPFEMVKSKMDEEHPADLMVASRLPQTELKERIKDAIDEILNALGERDSLWGNLEDKLNERDSERTEAYFNLGYEYGVAASRNADQLSRKYAKLLWKVGGQEIQALSGRVERQRGMREQVHASQCSSRKYRHLSPT